MRQFDVTPLLRRLAADHSTNSGRAGFTLIEICLVLLILALFLGLAIPNLRSTLVESQIRADEVQLSNRIQQLMDSATERGRSFRLELSANGARVEAEPGEPANSAADAAGDPALLRPVQFVGGDSLSWSGPDADSRSQWQFQPHELCPLPRLRISQGRAWMEFDCNPLTGLPENETSYFP